MANGFQFCTHCLVCVCVFIFFLVGSLCNSFSSHSAMFTWSLFHRLTRIPTCFLKHLRARQPTRSVFLRTSLDPRNLKEKFTEMQEHLQVLSQVVFGTCAVRRFKTWWLQCPPRFATCSGRQDVRWTRPKTFQYSSWSIR